MFAGERNDDGSFPEKRGRMCPTRDPRGGHPLFPQVAAAAAAMPNIPFPSFISSWEGELVGIVSQMLCYRGAWQNNNNNTLPPILLLCIMHSHVLHRNSLFPPPPCMNVCVILSLCIRWVNVWLSFWLPLYMNQSLMKRMVIIVLS